MNGHLWNAIVQNIPSVDGGTHCKPQNVRLNCRNERFSERKHVRHSCSTDLCLLLLFRRFFLWRFPTLRSTWDTLLWSISSTFPCGYLNIASSVVTPDNCIHDILQSRSRNSIKVKLSTALSISIFVWRPQECGLTLRHDILVSFGHVCVYCSRRFESLSLIMLALYPNFINISFSTNYRTPILLKEYSGNVCATNRLLRYPTPIVVIEKLFCTRYRSFIAQIARLNQYSKVEPVP